MVTVRFAMNTLDNVMAVVPSNVSPETDTKPSGALGLVLVLPEPPALSLPELEPEEALPEAEEPLPALPLSATGLASS